MNLKPYDAMEPKRFVNYYESMASGSGVMLAAPRGDEIELKNLHEKDTLLLGVSVFGQFHANSRS